MYIDTADSRDSFDDLAVVRTVPITGDSALPVYFIAMLPVQQVPVIREVNPRE